MLDGTHTPFKLSTLEARPSVKIAEGIDTSHYDGASKRFVFHTEPDKNGADLVVLDAATLKEVGEICVPARKAGGADADGTGRLHLASQDRGEVYVIDTRSLKVMATWSIPTCGKPISVATDVANQRVFVSCRGNATAKPAVETLGTQAWVNVLAMDHAAQRLQSIRANGTSDAGKEINTAVSPYYINSVFPNTFSVLIYGK